MSTETEKVQTVTEEEIKAIPENPKVLDKILGLAYAARTKARDGRFGLGDEVHYSRSGLKDVDDLRFFKLSLVDEVVASLPKMVGDLAAKADELGAKLCVPSLDIAREAFTIRWRLGTKLWMPTTEDDRRDLSAAIISLNSLSKESRERVFQCFCTDCRVYLDADALGEEGGRTCKGRRKCKECEDEIEATVAGVLKGMKPGNTVAVPTEGVYHPVAGNVDVFVEYPDGERVKVEPRPTFEVRPNATVTPITGLKGWPQMPPRDFETEMIKDTLESVGISFEAECKELKAEQEAEAEMQRRMNTQKADVEVSIEKMMADTPWKGGDEKKAQARPGKAEAITDIGLAVIEARISELYNLTVPDDGTRHNGMTFDASALDVQKSQEFRKDSEEVGAYKQNLTKLILDTIPAMIDRLVVVAKYNYAGMTLPKFCFRTEAYAYVWHLESEMHFLNKKEKR